MNIPVYMWDEVSDAVTRYKVPSHISIEAMEADIAKQIGETEPSYAHAIRKTEKGVAVLEGLFGHDKQFRLCSHWLPRDALHAAKADAKKGRES